MKALVAVVAAMIAIGTGVDQAGTGRLAGTVKLTTVKGGRSTASPYAARTVGPRASPLPEARNVIVYFTDIKASADLRAMKAEIAQQDEQFTPHVVAVTAGSTVEFPNRDPFFHNVFSLSGPKSFDLGRYAPGVTRSERFTKPGLVKVYCRIHSQMSAVVRVFDHPWFTIPDENGTFTMDNLPAGEFTLVAWHERIGEQRDRVTIKPGATTNVTFTLPVLEPAK